MVHVKKGNEMRKFKFGDRVQTRLLSGKWVNAVITSIDNSGTDEMYWLAFKRLNGWWVRDFDLKRGWAKKRRKK
jgi:hypothetical protein